MKKSRKIAKHVMSSILGVAFALIACVVMDIPAQAMASAPAEDGIVVLDAMDEPCVELEYEIDVPLAAQPTGLSAPIGATRLETPDKTYSVEAMEDDEIGNTTVSTADGSIVILSGPNVAVYDSDGEIYVYDACDCSMV